MRIPLFGVVGSFNVVEGINGVGAVVDISSGGLNFCLSFKASGLFFRLFILFICLFTRYT